MSPATRDQQSQRDPTGNEPAIRTPGELFSLDGKVVVLTGASSGLGARWAPVLAAAGARVVITARRDAELAEVARQSQSILAVPGDVTSDDHRRTLVAAAIDTFGTIDVLVNNAGTAASAPALDTQLEDFGDLIETDLTAVFALTQLVGRHMVKAARGSIINITSLGAERCLDRYPLAAYNAAKAGVAALTRSFASEWGPHGVRANSLGPAFFPTRLSGFLQDRAQTEWIASHTALRRPANLDELDGALLFLASDASSYITGQHLFVDGGWSVY
jgi:NAD(P)-dependent dehydrogenase (short-subunit alcohol dehydrogenase family)